MKREMDLIRSLLLTLEEIDTPTSVSKISIPHYTKEQIVYHSFLLMDAGLIKAEEANTWSANNVTFFRITNAGHDFIDNIRNDGIWKKTKQIISEKTGSASIEIVISIAKELVLRQFSTG